MELKIRTVLLLSMCILFVKCDNESSLSGPVAPSSDDPNLMELWDDFSYSSSEDRGITDHGWIIKNGLAGPGPAGCSYSDSNITFFYDSTNRIMRLLASTSGTGASTSQAEICSANRKFLEGTYAARGPFSDEPFAGGPDGDQIVQTFFTIAPLAYDDDPSYSEMDFEYVPNGGWEFPETALYLTTWETYTLEPWRAKNQSDEYKTSYAGWNTLLIQVDSGTVKYYVNGVLHTTHGGKNYPDSPMSINFNHWYIGSGLLQDTTFRKYRQEVDWVYFVKNKVQPRGSRCEG